MALSEVFRFMRDLGQQPDGVSSLREQNKESVLLYAKNQGYNFTEIEFDQSMWGIEIHLANKLEEPFDFNFSLWETMWGHYYLDFLVKNTVGAVTEQDISNFITQQSHQSSER
jgi:hypothetical protein